MFCSDTVWFILMLPQETALPKYKLLCQRKNIATVLKNIAVVLKIGLLLCWRIVSLEYGKLLSIMLGN